MKCIFAVVGEDSRQRAAAAWLAAQPGVTVVGTEEIYRAEFILLPTPLEPDRLALGKLLRAAQPGAVAFGGRVSSEVQAAGESAGVPILDYLLRGDFAALNAVPTAEGCISLLMEHRERTVWGSRIAVVGWGHIGKALAPRLAALGAQVTVAARRAESRAGAQAAGFEAVPLSGLAETLRGCDAVVNTVPAPVLGETELGALGEKGLVVDLASRPGGTDFSAAKRLNVPFCHALGLPGRCAPATAGELLGRICLDMAEEQPQKR